MRDRLITSAFNLAALGCYVIEAGVSEQFVYM